MIQTVVAEIRVRDRGHIEPVFRVPIFGTTVMDRCPRPEPDERDETWRACSCRLK